MFSDSDDSDWYSDTEAYDDGAIQAEGIHATVYRRDGERSLRAVKSVSAFKNARLEPHDIRSEIHILARLSHPNIIELVDASYVQKLFQFSMPFIPLTLADLLDSPQCSPHPCPYQAPTHVHTRPERFTTLSKSLLFQLTSALAFLHTRPNPIAHRDLKPSNVLVTPAGCVKLIDFGISWEGKPRGEAADFSDLHAHGLTDNGRLSGFSDAPKPEWEEQPEKMCCQVSSGPYRAPELLFAPKHYNALSIDLWSLGALAAGFFTSLRFEAVQPRRESEFDWDALIRPSESMLRHDDEGDASPGAGLTRGDENPPLPDPTIPFDPPTPSNQEGKWRRTTLFDNTKGEIGLVASIFRIMGTPTQESWPDFTSLPAASALTFAPIAPQPLQPLLPNLPLARNTLPEIIGHKRPTETSTSNTQGPMKQTPNSNRQENHISALGENTTSLTTKHATTTSIPGHVSTSVYGHEAERALDVIQNLIRYPPEARTPASDLLRHDWFTCGLPVLHPDSAINIGDSLVGEHAVYASGVRTTVMAGENGEGYTLADLISELIDPNVL